MRKLLLATVATAALSFPALAQNAAQPSDMQNPTQQQTNQQSGTSGAAAGQQQDMTQSQQPVTIRASQLSKRDIREIQMNLNKQGFDAGHADGVWGPDTDAALKNFQQAQNLPGDGQLNQQTLQALGVNAGGANVHNEQTSPGQPRQGAETTGQAPSENQDQNQSQGMQTQQPNASPSSGSENGSQSGGQQQGQ
jgi:peptidoglycan hydrolase-like protein with peptidoglycan-binding domain